MIKFKNQLQQLIVSGNLLCSKEEVAKLAGIQLRIQEINAYVKQHQEAQPIVNPSQTKQHLSTNQFTNLASYSQPSSSKTPPSSDLFTRTTFEQPITLSTLNQTTNSSINNQLTSTPAPIQVTSIYSSTGTSGVKLHPISEYGYKVSFSNILECSFLYF